MNKPMKDWQVGDKVKLGYGSFTVKKFTPAQPKTAVVVSDKTGKKYLFTPWQALTEVKRGIR